MAYTIEHDRCNVNTTLNRLEPINLLRSFAMRALLGLALLWLIALLVEPRTLALESVISMAPFVGVLGVAAIGQHLVIQQRGFDLSVAGNISLAAVIVTALPAPDAGVASTVGYVCLALAAGVLAGFLNGAVINWLRVPSLVVTIGGNALLIGCVFYMTRGAVHAAPDPLTAAASARVGPLSVLFLVFLALALFAAWVIDRTSIGRRFIGSAISPEASRVLGVKVSRYNILTYCIAGLLFSAAGVMLAGLAVTPTLLSGGPYMLTTVAAVIVGGSPLNGDRGSVVATMIGVIFLVFLNQLVVSLGFDYAIQSMVQAAIILAGVTVPELMRRGRIGKRSEPSASSVKARPHANAAASTMAISAAQAPVLELEGVRKTFGSTIALAGVDFSAVPGEVHAIIGENGAGKSTLISIASGVLPASEGVVKIAGQRIDGADPNRSRAAGISVAFQHPPLPPHLTVLECLCLASDVFAQGDGARRASELINRVAIGSLRASPQDRISDLSIGQRHVVEIARALASDPKIFILDEPTEPFKEDDVVHLFSLIRELKAQGVAIIYISHRLKEVEEIADRISVLRDGELVETRRRADFTHAEIINMIVGRPLGNVFPPKFSDESAPTLLKVRNLSGLHFHDVSFEAKQGEIVGIAGVEGQGQRELMRALAGMESFTGDIELGGRALLHSDRSSARLSKVAFVPDDRHREGLFLSLSVEENIGVGFVASDGPSVLIDRAAEKQAVAASIRDLKIKTASASAIVSSLSGGNQQKVLIGREIGAQPQLFLADEPTKGVDIGSKSDIYQKTRDLANQGVAVVVASSDGVELEGLCDRVIVMARGAVACELRGAKVSDAEITTANLTAGHSGKQKGEVASGKSWFNSLLQSRWLPALVLSVASLLIVYAAVSVNGRFLSAYNLQNVQVQLATLALIGFGQLFLMLLGEIDFSVGPLAGLVVVLASYWIPEQATPSTIVLAMGAIILLSALIGLAQGILVVMLNLPSIVVTLAGFFALQGLSLSLRPVPGGTISDTMVQSLLVSVGPVSVVTIVAIVAALAFERTLFRTHFGRSLRASGSSQSSASKLGVKRNVLTPVAFAVNGALVGIAGLVLAATVGVGSGTAGINFTLMSITAVVLGGAVISGGFGSFISTWFGALLVQLTFSATTFMQVGVEWQYWLVGITTLFAAGLFSFGRRSAAHE
ncbi:ATP-binding cassette domain-containing protein [Variovorax sp. J31P207]|uniref:ATP-binding cassette domain-containing protein n=1 Tax=Variovorax sp. J31P207 TaxID=3053510 RepID=UPI002576195A|nr:ATP-binding cassette domain-containing protein [Variovorax sp. J31P207]MDM0071524.1 ATP-binding cassette domain-containing protein [Variovorax sp. J31P207]